MSMPVDYDEFRRQPWDQRVAVFNAISAGDKAQLVRTHTSRWIDAHRAELNAEQIAFLEECVAFITPELYQPGNERARARTKEIERRALALLTRDQAREALTMHWDLSCRW